MDKGSDRYKTAQRCLQDLTDSSQQHMARNFLFGASVVVWVKSFSTFWEVL
jgi:hypothetical protein